MYVTADYCSLVWGGGERMAEGEQEGEKRRGKGEGEGGNGEKEGGEKERKGNKRGREGNGEEEKEGMGR